MFTWLPLMPIKRIENERISRTGQDRRVGEVEDARARQRLLADYETCLQHGPERVHGVVPAGAAARLHQGHRERLAGSHTGAALTLGDELNKLASNISLGRDAAGVHYRSDGIERLKLGEAAAISMLRDVATIVHEQFSGFTLTRFDGTTVTICPEC
jgi:hypothetical protein